MPIYKQFLTTTGAGTWTVPSGVTSVTVECIGGGGNGQANGSSGGGGGAYSKKNSLSVTPGASISYSVGAVSGDTWFDGANFAASSCGAKGGQTANSTALFYGGQAADGIGDVKYSGGNGLATSTNAGGGGGGAAGPNGNGNNGTAGSGSTGGAGGSGDAGSGGSGGAANTAGGSGTEWSTTPAYGSGGGGGGGNLSVAGGAGGLYGAGGGGGGGGGMSGGAGKQGLIVLTYDQPLTLGEYLGAGSGTTKLLLHLNGNSTDSSGNGNNGVDTNITWVDGKFGKCASFNGSSSKIGCGDSNFDWINYNTPFTINAWIKHNYSSSGASGEEPTIVGKHESNNSPYPGFTFGLTRRTGVELNLDCQFISVFNANGQNFTVRSINMLPYQNIWTQVSMTYDGSGNASGMKFYVNGFATPMTTVSSSTTCNANITNNIQLGIGVQRYDNGANLFNGLIDEVIIENRAWSAQEVKKYYTNSRGFYATL